MKVLIKILEYVLIVSVSFLKMIKWRLNEHWELYDFWKEKFEYRKNVLIWIISNLPNLLLKRHKICDSQIISMSEIYKKLY